MLSSDDILALVLAAGGSPTSKILLWVFVLIVLIVVGGLAVVSLRRNLLANDSTIGHESGLMEEMRAMHARGELSNEEYDLIRKRLATRAADRIAEHALDNPERKPGGSFRNVPTTTPRGKPISQEAQRWLASIQHDLNDESIPDVPNRPPTPGPAPRPAPGPTPTPPPAPSADLDQDSIPLADESPVRPEAPPSNGPKARPGRDPDGFPDDTWPGTSE